MRLRLQVAPMVLVAVACERSNELECPRPETTKCMIAGARVLGCNEHYPQDTAVLGDRVYWPVDSSIVTAPIDGRCGAVAIWEDPDPTPAPTTVVVTAGDEVCWGGGDQLLCYSPQRGTRVAAAQPVHSLAADADAIYVASYASDKIIEVARRTGVVRVVAEEQWNTSRLAIDRDQVAWACTASNGLTGTIGRALRSGGPVEILASAIADPIEALAINDGEVFFSTVTCQFPGQLLANEHCASAVYSPRGGNLRTVVSAPDDGIFEIAGEPGRLFLATAYSLAMADPALLAQGLTTVLGGLGRPRGLTILNDALIVADPQHLGDTTGHGRVLVVPRR